LFGHASLSDRTQAQPGIRSAWRARPHGASLIVVSPPIRNVLRSFGSSPSLPSN
jgi:hypothetical protein